MRITTWNVNGVRARAERLREFLFECKPDVLCLQELKIKDGELAPTHFAELGYELSFVGQAGWNGVGVLSRGPIETRTRALPGAEEAGARFLHVSTLGLEVVSVYVPNGKTEEHPDFALKKAWLARLGDWLEARTPREAPLVVAGDFNVCTADLDSYLGEPARGTIFHTEEERALIARVAGAGLVDTFRVKHPDEPGFSWWDYRAGAFHKKLGMRIDLVFATPTLAARVADVTVDREFRKKSKKTGAVPSDHAPVTATLQD